MSGAGAARARAEPGRARGGGPRRALLRRAARRPRARELRRRAGPLPGNTLSRRGERAGRDRLPLGEQSLRGVVCGLRSPARGSAGGFDRPGGGFALAALAWVWRRSGATPPRYESRSAGSGGTAQLGPTDGGRIGRL